MPGVDRVRLSSNRVACTYWQLCVSMILEQDRQSIQTPDSPFWEEGPDYNSYDGDEAQNGYPKQLDYDEAYKQLMDEFTNDHWDCMQIKKQKESEGKRKYVHNGIAARNNENTDVEVICGEGHDGLWYKGPKQVTTCQQLVLNYSDGISAVQG